ncbi:DUF5717 family protein [Butyrivibrio sp. MC2013]|uniref:DUF5717 family protein n=1 Tax=Butyrivibrio sp. MC2013 TaxID=1280686 RepID=UPI0004209F1D|nr:DUF5717 family protein [Butyrivibrio sp. MC2013]
MRECIDRILNGQFEYERGNLEFSTTVVELTVNENEEIEGSFSIRGPKGKITEGSVSSSDMRMEVLTPRFEGEQDEIIYRFRSVGMNDRSQVSGFFRIISNRGEYQLPFIVKATEARVSSGMGDIRNLFHFANLARSDWNEALHIFYSSKFTKVLNGADARFESLYRGLSTVRGSDRNMEEFLISVSKKHPVSFVADTKSMLIDSPGENTDYCISLRKNGWGYSYLEIDTGSDAIKADKTVLTEDDFLGSTAYFHFTIDRSCLHEGSNYCNISFRNPSGVLTIPITVTMGGTRRKELAEHVERKKYVSELMKLYVDFRCKRTDSVQWLNSTKRLISRMLALYPDDIEFRLYNAQYQITAMREGEGRFALEELRPDIEEGLRRGGEYEQQLYCYYLYLQTLLTRDESDISRVSEIIEEVYKRNRGNWRIAWILQYVSEEFSTDPSRRWNFLRDLYMDGCNSPVILLDAVHILRNNVILLSRLEEFELSVLSFAARENILTIPMMEQVVYLALKAKDYSPSLFRILKKCYEICQDKDSLTAICLLLMKDDRQDKDSFVWYRKAVEGQLRITRLYEYYMMSIEEDEEGRPLCPIDKMVLMYFSYQSNLPWSQNAILYRYIHEHRAEFLDLYENYRIQIEKFILEEIDLGHISPALGYLYENMLTSQMVDSGNASRLLTLMHTAGITVEDPAISSVIVVYDKCRKLVRYSVRSRHAEIPLYGSEYTLLFGDDKGNIFASSIEYKVRKYMRAGDLPALTIPYIQKGRENLDLFLCELGRSAYTISLENAERYRDLADSDLISDDVRAEIRSGLIRFYYDNDFIRQLKEYLEALAPELLQPRQRSEMLELMVLTGMYDKALDWIRKFGCTDVDPKIIMRLVNRAFDQDADSDDPALAEIAWYSFRRGKYDEAELIYLCATFNGSVREMRDLYRASRSFGIDAWNLLGRIMVQMIYTGTYLGDQIGIYKDYVKSGTNTDIELAYLALSSYDYFVKDEVTDAYIYDRIGYLHMTGTQLPEICKLAWMRFHAESELTLPGDSDRAIMEAFLEDAIAAGLYFDFFKNCLDIIPAMNEYADRTFLEYRTDPHTGCIVNYMLVDGESDSPEYTKIKLKEMFEGVYVTDFVLFEGEKVQYYITEEVVDPATGFTSPQLTESGTLSCDRATDMPGKRRYKMINELTARLAGDDDKAVFKLASDYEKYRFLSEELFKMN